ncbi:MAG TPA: DUF5615 family PIN-like protein [Bryobacteraceae bacterium]|nr:DUF5615 family PIN-like protein [Bryobacteraceae bacterium]
MRILVDMNLAPRWVQALAEFGYEAIHWSTMGDPGAPDSEICAYARDNGYVVLTNDLDFPQILAHTRHRGPNVVLLRGEPLVPELRSQGLVRVLLDCEAELTAGAIVSVDWSGAPRARVLPLR